MPNTWRESHNMGDEKRPASFNTGLDWKSCRMGAALPAALRKHHMR